MKAITFTLTKTIRKKIRQLHTLIVRLKMTEHFEFYYCLDKINNQILICVTNESKNLTKIRKVILRNCSHFINPSDITCISLDPKVLHENQFMCKFLGLSNPLFIEIIDAIFTQNNNEILVGFDLLVLSALVNFENITRGYFSCRSHYDAYLFSHKEPDSVQIAFQNLFEKNADALSNRLLRIIHNYKNNCLSKNHKCWVSILKRTKKLAISTTRNSREDNGRSTGYDHSNSFGTIRNSPFHETMLSNADFMNYMQQNVNFKAFRLINTAVYRLLQNIGITSIKKYFICYSISKIVESKYNINPIDVIERFYLDNNKQPRLKYE